MTSQQWDGRMCSSRGLIPLLHPIRSHSQSRRIQQRLRKQNFTRHLANHTIQSLNYIYNPRVASSNAHDQTSDQLSTAVCTRLQNNIWRSCQQFQHLCSRSQDLSSSTRLSGTQQSPPQSTPLTSTTDSYPIHDHSTNSYTTLHSAVPIIADRIDLPDTISTVSLVDLLPPSAADRYNHPSNILKPISSQQMKQQSHRRARVFGQREEYVKLIKILHRIGMVQFRSKPLAVNGVFAVPKDGDRLRLIIDAQPANDLCVDPDPVLLPNPAHWLVYVNETMILSILRNWI
ncbi:MAG: hypothetical protein JWL77_7120 [Chthonomonadaceae bacterium]|nr:hypothetical protein [Chthonomonadaceae bacterium]